jgi:type IV pilus assembly protein PilE
MHNKQSYKATVAGFTLIELMIVVAIIAILGGIAYPNYTQYVLRGKITEATSSLSDLRLRAEKYFADNRTYQVVPASGTVAGFNTTVTGARYFSYACTAATATTFACTATGVGDLTGFAYTINQANTRASTISAAGWNSSTSCWVLKKGESC